jgi:riboflavin biosynthesis pyrimidine reductase
MKPYVVCHMITSLDGRLHPSRWTQSPDGTRAEWSALYDRIHTQLEGDAWLIGRVTMAEMAKGTPLLAKPDATVERPSHFATRTTSNYAIAVDQSAKLHFGSAEIGGDHIVVLLGSETPDSHLAELAANGISYIIAETPEMNLDALLDVLGRELAIKRLIVEGGGGINGSFLAAGLVDEISLLIAPAIDGAESARGIFVHGEAGLAKDVQLTFKSVEQVGHGALHLRYLVKPAN